MTETGLFFADLHLLELLAPLYVVWLALLALLPWLRRRLGRRAWASVRYSNVGRLTPLARTDRSVLARRLVGGLRWIVVALLLVAALRPQTGRTLTSVDTEGIDIVLVMDTSGSMQALDLDASERTIARRRDRLQVAVDVVRDFVAARSNDQIGLVVFGERAFTQVPLTLDHGIVDTFLERLEIGMAGDATALGEAVGIAVKRLEGSVADSKVIVLLTDGRNNAGALSPLTAAEVAKTLGVRIYAIGAGTRGKAPFVVQTAVGRRLVYENVEIDEEMLTAMAEATGGQYFRAEDESALEQIYAQIDELETTEITMESYTEVDERFAWFVVPALVLLLVEVLLLGTRLRTLP